MELTIDNVGVRFGGLWANRNISFTAPRNGIAAVIGPNGAGKTTLFNVITGFIKPTEGEVRLDGECSSTLPPERIARRGVARTFQIPEICRDLSVLDNVLVGAHRHIRGGLFGQLLNIGPAARSLAEAREQAEAELAAMRMWDLRHRSAQSLPLGKVRLLEIARALTSRPSLLLLDEAASGLNTREAAELATIIQGLPQRGIAVLLIEHNINFVMELAQTVAVLDHGTLLHVGTPEQVRQDESVISAYLGARRH
jgi:ABC-type branched-subunit amino acid transport system ATPase component